MVPEYTSTLQDQCWHLPALVLNLNVKRHENKVCAVYGYVIPIQFPASVWSREHGKDSFLAVWRLKMGAAYL